MTNQKYGKNLATVVLEVEYDPEHDSAPQRSKLLEILRGAIDNNPMVNDRSELRFKKDEDGRYLHNEDGGWVPRESSSHRVTRLKTYDHDDMHRMHPAVVDGCKDTRLHKWDLDITEIVRHQALNYNWTSNDELVYYVDVDGKRISMSFEDALMILISRSQDFRFTLNASIIKTVREYLQDFLRGEMEDIEMSENEPFKHPKIS